VSLDGDGKIYTHKKYIFLYGTGDKRILAPTTLLIFHKFTLVSQILDRFGGVNA